LRENGGRGDEVEEKLRVNIWKNSEEDRRGLGLEGVEELLEGESKGAGEEPEGESEFFCEKKGGAESVGVRDCDFLGEGRQVLRKGLGKPGRLEIGLNENEFG
jgi:hypothetical protein